MHLHIPLTVTSIAKERPGGCFYSSSHIISKKQPAGSLPFVSHLIRGPSVQALTLQLFPYICPVPQRSGTLAWFAIILFLPSHPLKDTSSFKDVCYLMRPPECNCHGNRYCKYKNVHFLELSMKLEKQLAEITVLRGSSQYLPGCSLEMRSIYNMRDPSYGTMYVKAVSPMASLLFT